MVWLLDKSFRRSFKLIRSLRGYWDIDWISVNSVTLPSIFIFVACGHAPWSWSRTYRLIFVLTTWPSQMNINRWYLLLQM